MTTIQVIPPQLEAASPTFTQNSGQAGSMMSDLQTATNQAVSALEGAASIGGLGTVADSLNALSGQIAITIQCFSDALSDTGKGLVQAGQLYAHNDAQLEALFGLLGQALENPVAPAPATKPHHSFWSRVSHDLGNWGKDAWHWFTKTPTLPPPPSSPGAPIEEPPIEVPPIEVPIP